MTSCAVRLSGLLISPAGQGAQGSHGACSMMIARNSLAHRARSPGLARTASYLYTIIHFVQSRHLQLGGLAQRLVDRFFRLQVGRMPL